MTQEDDGNGMLEAARSSLASAWEQESATTLRVVRAYPEEERELRPHPRAKTARELAWLFTLEMGMAAAAVRDEMDLSRGMPPAPESIEEIAVRFETARADLLDALRGAAPEDLAGTVRFFTGPKQMGDVPRLDFLRFLLHDQIHHRGQFSIYLRMSGAKVPSIYGPTADEPWH